MKHRSVRQLAFAMPTLVAVASANAAESGGAEHTNRLAQEKSPYLLQHAHNPVDWYPWGDEAFAEAKKENKPIFLSVGYSTCHWCHVMEHESFENPAIAKLMNDNFVNIKVDREERPDIDQVYMTFVQATTGRGGWPMNVWLTPDLKPFVGGTYFPPEARDGMPGLPSVLTKIASAWKTDREKIVASSDQMLDRLRAAVEQSDSSGKLADGVREKAYQQFASNFDAKFGGFGQAPKFPRPVAFNFLYNVYGSAPESAERKRALEMAVVTLRKMAAGGIHDHIGGGFHRYSTDKFWHVPHFEKMLYDQAQLAIAYLTAFQITRDPLFEKIARDILDYVRRDLTDKDGGFYSAEDADSLLVRGKPEQAEGAFYVWSKDEIDRLLGPEKAKVFDLHYGIEAKGNAPEDPHGEFKNKNILIARQSIAETAKKLGLPEEKTEQLLAESRKILFDARAKRPRPHLDDKIITGWNGLMISAFARAAQILGDGSYLEVATKAADFIQQKLYRDETQTLLRSYREGASDVNGFASDYAFLAQGLLDLYEASFDIGRIQWAIKLQERQDELFGDAKQGGYFSTAASDANVLLRMKEADDMAEPSPNSVAALNLLRIGYILDDANARERANRTIEAFAKQLEAAPSSMPQMLVALSWARAKPKQIVIAGKPGDAATNAMLHEVHRHFLPHRVLILSDGGAGQQFFSERVEFTKSVGELDDRATAYVCENFVCQLPTNDPGKLAQLLRGKAPPASSARR
ncbi:MAG TPA: thioredoxin domain-containing protein [Chthoniobacterales bacterium]|nr:thioredoxin domain-containing protein [Chthoniobacterales bacterium]